jgi:transposase
MGMEIHGGRRFRSNREKRQIVEETLKPGASVSTVARSHDVNANQVFFWRKQYRQGGFDEIKDAATALVPVKISAAKHKAVTTTRRALKLAARMVPGSIDIDLGHARVRIEGAADPECVRAALEGLGR